jgi:DNA-binding transcriptional LysR family regulator
MSVPPVEQSGRMDLNEMLVFARVVDAGSFTTAAAALGMPKSTVSRKVTELEARLGARLINRTTRKLSLTDVGRTYYEYCARIASEIEDAERAVNDLQAAPRGALRLTAGTNSAYLGPIVSDYLRRYPDVRVELFCTGRRVDLVEERFDLGIRAGPLADSTLISRSLGVVSWFLVASPAYLKKRGRPRSIGDLPEHDCLMFGTAPTGAGLRLVQGGKSTSIPVSTRLLVNDFDLVHDAVMAGLGFALLPGFQCLDDIRARRLERVLRDWDAPSTPVHVVYPSARHLSPKVKSFVDHLHERMTPPPWELGPLP